MFAIFAQRVPRYRGNWHSMTVTSAQDICASTVYNFYLLTENYSMDKTAIHNTGKKDDVIDYMVRFMKEYVRPEKIEGAGTELHHLCRLFTADYLKNSSEFMEDSVPVSFRVL